MRRELARRQEEPASLAAFVYHPYIASLTDKAALASDAKRGGCSHLAVGIVTSRVLSRKLTWLVVGALVVMAATRFVPLGAALCVGGAAAVVALWPLAYEMWRRPEAARPAGQPQPMPAT